MSSHDSAFAFYSFIATKIRVFLIWQLLNPVHLFLFSQCK
ncbi:hypothetical protein LPE509_01868 [Legionella pneumophila subsp. pneumophila LPE509]|nr:hypothetical protein LPE509_01868 [Legionella pneumophila subsp. pneumophila LPE509]